MGTGDRLVYLSEKHHGDVFIDSLGHTGTLSKERATSEPVLSSGISAGLISSKYSPLARKPSFADLIPSVLSTASTEPTGLLSQGALLTALDYCLLSLKCTGYLSYTKVFYE